MSPPNYVILHCAATPDYSKDHKKFDSIGAKEIRKWHMRDNGWRDIGYHWVIRQSGIIEPGRPEKELGAHCKGHNDAIGVCYAGTDDPNSKQVDSLCELYLDIYTRHGIGFDDWHGHNEYTNKECPGISMVLVKKLFKMYRELN